jgi:hypothetical protein
MRPIRAHHAAVSSRAESRAQKLNISCPRANAKGITRGIDLLMPSDVDDGLRMVCCRMLSMDVSKMIAMSNRAELMRATFASDDERSSRRVCHCRLASQQHLESVSDILIHQTHLEPVSDLSVRKKVILSGSARKNSNRRRMRSQSERNISIKRLPA